MMLLCSLSLPTVAGSLRIFGVDSYRVIQSNFSGRSYLLVLWSLDCSPCMKELKILSDFRRQYPDFRLVLVSTDAEADEAEITQVLSGFGLDDTDNRVFSRQPESALRYAVDPLWYGELPRSYFHLPGQPRESSSGALSWRRLLDWQRRAVEADR